ncbi:MAG: hypothetical protein E7422_11765 [Ruminococcaceae bacterium]|jgi:membrane protein DedA with SNARE-associated domain|nr:hypothetical protein [Oscillospiraceae bacterium]
MKNPKISRLFCVFCWLGTLTAALLEGYMLYMMKSYPEIESFARNVRIAGVLLLIWLAVSAYFTVWAWKEKGKK